MNAIAAPPSINSRRAQSEMPSVRRSFIVRLENGLHARPCAMLIKTLQPYQSAVEVEVNHEKASGKSILGLMSLGAAHGSKITFSITGEDAFEAMAEVERIFSADFEEDWKA
jgi:phosphotransferase system HPr (HPr) family protein